MKKIFFTLTLAMLMFSLGSGVSIAEDFAPEGSKKMTTVLKNLKSAGYKAVGEIEYDDGVFKAKAMNAQNQFVKVRVDAKTGKVVKPKKNAAKKAIGLLKAAKKVESAGYSRIYEMETKPRAYKVKAFNKEGKRVELSVDADTGEISKFKWKDKK
jgi:uncharacterized membrane protein YkoI